MGGRVVAVWAVVFLCAANTAAEDLVSGFRPVRDRLVADGLDTRWVHSLYSDRRCEWLQSIAAINLKHIEDTIAYKSFLSETNLQIARSYMGRQGALLDRFEKKTEVSAEIVTAILLVETKCGLDRDKAAVFNVLSTIAASSGPEHVEKSFKDISEKYPGITRAELNRRSKSRSRWAYKELKIFLEWLEGRTADEVISVRGSWAGALGLPQFMPSSLVSYGADGDGDGRIDLYSDADAVASICRYLSRHGWRGTLSEKKRRKIIWHYNHSPHYVETVLAIAERLRRS